MALVLVAKFASSALVADTITEQLLPPAQTDDAGFQRLHQPLTGALKSHTPRGQCDIAHAVVQQPE